MRTVKILFYCHLAALVFGLGGLLIALPHPELWNNNPFAVEVFNFGIRYPGSLHILFGAATMLLKPTREVQHAATTKLRASIAKRISLLTVYAGSRALTSRKVQVMVEGLEYVPHAGPVLIAARHFHHLYDGCILLGAIPRKLHIFVALDWVQKRWLRRMMEWACAMADWPAMLRIERLNEDAGDASQAEPGAYSRDESARYLRRAAMDSVRLLRSGEALVVFPEAYPTIDPKPTPKKDNDAFLPFRPGFAKLVEMAERDGCTQVAIVPAGLIYVKNRQWHVTLRFGPALSRRDYADTTQVVQALEEQVRALSSSMGSLALTNPGEVIHS